MHATLEKTRGQLVTVTLQRYGMQAFEECFKQSKSAKNEDSSLSVEHAQYSADQEHKHPTLNCQFALLKVRLCSKF